MAPDVSGQYLFTLAFIFKSGFQGVVLGQRSLVISQWLVRGGTSTSGSSKASNLSWWACGWLEGCIPKLGSWCAPRLLLSAFPRPPIQPVDSLRFFRERMTSLGYFCFCLYKKGYSFLILKASNTTKPKRLEQALVSPSSLSRTACEVSAQRGHFLSVSARHLSRWGFPSTPSLLGIKNHHQHKWTLNWLLRSPHQDNHPVLSLLIPLRLIEWVMLINFFMENQPGIPELHPTFLGIYSSNRIQFANIYLELLCVFSKWV